MLNLFVGVICTAMDDAHNTQKEEKAMENSIVAYLKLAKVTATEAKGYRKAFHMMDIDNSKTIEVCAWVWWCTR